MNEILPRISPNGTGTRRIVLLNGGRHPSNVGRDGHNVLPRIGGGVSAKVVLANAGINRGPLVRVTAWKAAAGSKGNEEAARKRAAKVADEIKQGAAKVTFHKVEKKKHEEGTGLRAEKEPITEEETRLADLLEAAQEVKPIVEKYGGEYLIRSEKVTCLHPQRMPQRVIIIRFPSRDALNQCFSSEEYKAIMNKRVSSVDARAIIVEE